MEGGDAHRVKIHDCAVGSPGRSLVAIHVLLRTLSDALYGTGACDRHNCERSCFAAERCDRGLATDPPALSRALLNESTCYIATDKDRLLGIVAIENSGYIHSLCVTHEARSRGVGERLMRHVMAHHSHQPLHLTIARPRGVPGPARDVLHAGAPRLQAFYERLGFRGAHDDCSDYYRMDLGCPGRH